MKFSSMFTGLVAGFAAITTVVSSPIALEKRGPQEVLDAISNLSEKLVCLNETASGYKGGIVGIPKAIKIQIQSGQVQTAINRATSSVVDSTEEQFDLLSSADISVAMVELRPKILSTLQTMISKEPEFRKGVLGLGVIPLNGIVRSSLEKQFSSSQQFADALVAKLHPTYGSIAFVLINSINKAFEEAIAVFS